MPTRRVRPPYKVAWTYDARHLMEYSPIVVGDTLYGIDNNGEAFALNTRNGKQRWRRDVATLNASAPTYSDGRLYVSNLEPGQVQALKARTGKVAWHNSLPGRTESSPLVVGDEVIAGCECASVYAFDKRSGKQLWSTPVGGAVKASPAFSNGVVYVGDYSGEMTAIRASNGQVKWQTSVGNRIYGTATVAFGHVYAGDLGGGFHAFDEDTGSLSWSSSAPQRPRRLAIRHPPSTSALMTEPSTRSTPAPAASAGPSLRTARSQERAAWWATSSTSAI
jgi:outer membrane protein assembly factor BamB